MSVLKYSIAQTTGIPSLVNYLNRNRLLVLAYHGIYDGPRRGGTLPNTFVHVEEMVRQLRYIKNKYHVINPDELVASLETGLQLPPHAALITFDDGYENFYRLAFPVLRSFGIRALVFLATKYVEDNEPFWFDLLWLFIKHSSPDEVSWLANLLGLRIGNLGPSAVCFICIEKMKRMLPKQRNDIINEITELVVAEFRDRSSLLNLFYPMSDKQLRELAGCGISFGGHTHTHTILSVLPEDLAKTEIFENKRKLESIVEMPCCFFAYPNGGPKDFSHNHKKVLKDAGYLAAFSLTQRRTSPHHDSMAISRVNVAPEDTLTSLSFRCTGITSFIK